MLAAAVAAQASSTILVNGVAFLLPVLHTGYGLSLARAGLLVALPSVGAMLALIAWGALADRWGDRLVLVLGLGLTGLATAAAAASAGSWPALGGFLLLAGAAGASANAASGRVVVGWFPPHRRGLAMGIRQSAQPLGVAVAALVLPGVAAASGIGAALLLPAVATGVVAAVCGLVVVDPPRASRVAAARTGELANPYRADRRLVRIHAVSVLLVVPQFTVMTFALVWLVGDRGWTLTAAGALVAVAQVLGAVGRLAAGVWSDHVGSRLRPLRTVAAAASVTMAALAITDPLPGPWAVVLLVVATVVTVADNGLAFTSVAEIGGPWWAGRALGAQNTAQFLAAAAVAPIVGALIGGAGYALTFGVVALLPLLAVPLVPVEARPGPGPGPGPGRGDAGGPADHSRPAALRAR